MPHRKKSGKELSIYISDANLAYIDSLITRGFHKSRSAALEAVVNMARMNDEKV